jgi:hypothetical protein
MPTASEQGNLTDQVFERVKVYLDQKVSNLTSTLTAKAGRDLRLLTTGQQLKLAGDKDQFLFNAELETSIEDSSDKQDVLGALQTLQTAQKALHLGRKKIKLANNSDAGWLAVKEYEAEDLASDSDDEKRVKKAQASAVRKKAKARQATSINQTASSVGLNRSPGRSDNQLFRGNSCMSIIIWLIPSFSSPFFVLSAG